MISEGSCDTKDWSNDAENKALITGINYILIYIQIKKKLFEIVIIFHNMNSAQTLKGCVQYINSKS